MAYEIRRIHLRYQNQNMWDLQNGMTPESPDGKVDIEKLPNLDGTDALPDAKKQKIDAQGNVYTWEPNNRTEHVRGDGKWLLTGHVDLPGLEKKYGKNNLPDDLTGEVNWLDPQAIASGNRV